QHGDVCAVRGRQASIPVSDCTDVLWLSDDIQTLVGEFAEHLEGCVIGSIVGHDDFEGLDRLGKRRRDTASQPVSAIEGRYGDRKTRIVRALCRLREARTCGAAAAHEEI